VKQTIPKRISNKILQALAAGVVPREGLENIAVGRKDEVAALLRDLDEIVAEGGASFRVIVGRYGSGKSFLGQLIRNYGLARGFVVADADLSPVTRLTGASGQGVALYRELVKNMATRTRPEGGAFSAILERWISDMQQAVVTDGGLEVTDPAFTAAVSKKIHSTVQEMQEMVHGFDFATVLTAYWNGHQAGNDEQKAAALKWLRAEFTTKTQAKAALGVNIIIEDDSWYDYLKLLGRFVTDIGYKGLIVFIDEAVNLYKISNSVSRSNNYERLLSILNDVLQGKASHIGFIISATPQMLEDRQRGLYSYEALRTRLQESRFAQNGLRDLSGPVIRLDLLSHEELFVLLQKLREIHAVNYGYNAMVSDDQIAQFLNTVLSRIGADQMLTPRDVIRDFIAILNVLQQHPGLTFEGQLGSALLSTAPPVDPERLSPENEIDDSEFSSFSI
jgi:hypothetical protein